MTQIIAVIDYGMGNLRSVVKALEFVADKNAKVILTNQPERVANADRVVFPGQGAARDCMRALGEHGLDEVVRQAAAEKPFLGICMGLQVLMTHSEENDGTDLLNLYSGEVKHFPRDFPRRGMKIPHMGWNTLHEVWPHPLFKNIVDGSYFYFVHSYYVSPLDENLTVGKTEYGIQYTAAIARENVFAIQCHPEKSAESGLQLLKNFIHWDGQV
jgi:glutamine amidotransferase